MSIIMIACTDMNDGIGMDDGSLLFDLPKDMKHFKSITTGKHVVMGRTTWDSLPVKPLPKRKNYVLTDNRNLEVSGNTKLVHSVEEVLEMAKDKDVYIIGGGHTYYQFMPYAEKLIITHVHYIDMKAEVFFPEIEKNVWKPTSMQKIEADENHAHSFTFTVYEKQ